MIREVLKESPQTRIETEGVTLHLECGHKNWHGGLTKLPDKVECCTCAARWGDR